MNKRAALESGRARLDGDGFRGPEAQEVRLRIGPPRSLRPVQLPLIHEWSLPDGSIWTRFYRAQGGYLLRFPDLGEFHVSSQGTEVTSWAVPGVSEDSIRHLYLNQVLPLALSRQGRLVFHGSAVELEGEGVAFLGRSGSGKSTLAASFATSGWRFLADDGLALQEQRSAISILPSHPSIRLWEDSQMALIGPAERAVLPVPFSTKMRFLAGEKIAFCEEPRRVRCLYFLAAEASQGTEFASMQPSEALIELVRHSFLLDTREQDQLAAHFDRLSELANRTRCFRLRYPRQFRDLAHVRGRIVEHARMGGTT